MNKPNIVFGTIGMAFSVAVYVLASSYPTPPGNSVGPGYFPIMLACGLFALSASLVIRAVLKMDKESFPKLDIHSPELIRSFLALCGTVIYALVMDFLGFIPASIIYLFGLMYLLKNREYKKMAAVAVGASIAVYFIFSNLLNLTLPQGFFL